MIRESPDGLVQDFLVSRRKALSVVELLVTAKFGQRMCLAGLHTRGNLSNSTEQQALLEAEFVVVGQTLVANLKDLPLSQFNFKLVSYGHQKMNYIPTTSVVSD